MTHNQWEHGERLTIHNATKEQLKFMVRDRDEEIRHLQKELSTITAAIAQCGELIMDILEQDGGRELISNATNKERHHKEAIIQSVIENYRCSVVFGFSSTTAQAINAMEQAWIMCSGRNVSGIDQLNETIREAKEKFKDELEELNEQER